MSENAPSEALARAFLAGFMASGEGWNGEHPARTPEQWWPDIERGFDQWADAQRWEDDHPGGVISPEERASMDAHAGQQNDRP